MTIPVAATLTRRSLLTAGAGLAATSVVGTSACSILDPGTKVATDFFAMIKDTTDLPPSGVVVSEEAMLITPGAGAQLTTVSSVSSLSPQLAAKLQGDHTTRLAAPDGHQFLVVGVEGLMPAFKDLEKAKLQVVVGANRGHDLGQPFGAYLWKERRYERMVGGFCVCVPKDAAARLEITDQGKTAKLDLRTGTRVADEDTAANDVFLTRPNVVPPTEPVVWKAEIVTQPGADYEAEKSSATLTFSFPQDYTWVSPFGTTWAKRGRQWLGLGMTCAAKWTGSMVSMDTTTDKVFTFVDRFGNRHPAVSEKIDHLAASDGTWVLRFDVPVGVNEGEVHVKFDQKLVVHYTNMDVPARFTKRDKDLVIPLQAKPW